MSLSSIYIYYKNLCSSIARMIQIGVFLVNQIDSEVAKWKRVGITTKGFCLSSSAVRWTHLEQNPDINISKFLNIYERQKARESSGKSQNFMQCTKKEECRIRKAGH